MRLIYPTTALAALLLVWSGTAPTRAQDPGNPPPIPAQEEPEVLTSGPVHEAFAEPVNMEDDDDDLIATKAPPATIEEQPPTERPEGDRYVWVPGYWSWEPDRANYVWVSACWRVAPPNMSWVPGYWSERSGGWEWVPGFWSAVETNELEYLPAPPPTPPADLQPPGPPPTEDQTWVPACWYWSGGHYVRRPGYWLRQTPGWVWVPAHPVWTPRGYVFVRGHWDYPLETRGVLFAPVRFREPDRLRVGFSFSPGTVIDISLMTDHLFTSPRNCHYYFGDYYDETYIKIGIYPWFDRDHRRGWYDPIFEYDRVTFRSRDPRWEVREREEYVRLRDNRDLRPTRTYRELEIRESRLPEPQRREVRIARPIQQVVVNNTTNIKFTQINNESRDRIVRQATEVRNYRDQRSRWESAADTNARPAARDNANQRSDNPRNDNARNDNPRNDNGRNDTARNDNARNDATPSARDQRDQRDPRAADVGNRDTSANRDNPGAGRRDNTPQASDDRSGRQADRTPAQNPDRGQVQTLGRDTDTRGSASDTSADRVRSTPPTPSDPRNTQAARGSADRADTSNRGDRGDRAADRGSTIDRGLPVDRGTADRPSRSVRAREPERVNVPSSPISGRNTDRTPMPDAPDRGRSDDRGGDRSGGRR